MIYNNREVKEGDIFCIAAYTDHPAYYFMILRVYENEATILELYHSCKISHLPDFYFETREYELVNEI